MLFILAAGILIPAEALEYYKEMALDELITVTMNIDPSYLTEEGDYIVYSPPPVENGKTEIFYFNRGNFVFLLGPVDSLSTGTVLVSIRKVGDESRRPGPGYPRTVNIEAVIYVALIHQKQ